MAIFWRQRGHNQNNSTVSMAVSVPELDKSSAPGSEFLSCSTLLPSIIYPDWFVFRLILEREI